MSATTQILFALSSVPIAALATANTSEGDTNTAFTMEIDPVEEGSESYFKFLSGNLSSVVAIIGFLFVIGRVLSTLRGQQNHNSSSPEKKSWFSEALILVLSMAGASEKSRSYSLSAGGEFIDWYMVNLIAFPLVTKSITTGVMQLLGDVGAQIVENYLEQETARREKKEAPPSVSYQTFQFRRAFCVCLDGVLVAGPLMHCAYDFLERVLPTEDPGASGMQSTLAALSHVVINDYILDCGFIAILFITSGLGEGYKISEIFSQMKKDYVPAVKASWGATIVTVPVEFVCFNFLPSHFRVLCMNVIDIVWGTLVSYMAHRHRDVHEHEKAKKE